MTKLYQIGVITCLLLLSCLSLILTANASNRCLVIKPTFSEYRLPAEFFKISENMFHFLLSEKSCQYEVYRVSMIPLANESAH